jgi:O-antigen/teichoic acid export membrane protein
MRRHLTNAGYGVLDYISYPAGMLLVAPIILHRLGAAEYGLWMIATAVISAGGITASGFGDACIQRIAYLRGTNELERAADSVRSIMSINLGLGSLLAFGVWCVAPLAAHRVAAVQFISPAECLIALRIAGIAILIRAMESVPVGGLRAFEQYRETVQISTAMRLVTLASAGALAAVGEGTTAILLATCVFLVLGTVMQFRALAKVMRGAAFQPGFSASDVGFFLRKGSFVWLQALGGVIFGQLDRILLGVSLGALAVAPYSLCVQFAHPIFGLSASGLNFLFPHFSKQFGAESRDGLRRASMKAVAWNLAIVLFCALFLLLFGDRLIQIWAGNAVAESAKSILPPIVIGSALAGLSVTGTYVLQALGEFQTVAWIGLGGRAAMLLLAVELLRHHGLQGLAFARLCFGAVSLLVYLPLVQKLRNPVSKQEPPPPLSFAAEEQEASQS